MDSFTDSWQAVNKRAKRDATKDRLKFGINFVSEMCFYIWLGFSLELFFHFSLQAGLTPGLQYKLVPNHVTVVATFFILLHFLFQNCGGGTVYNKWRDRKSPVLDLGINQKFVVTLEPLRQQI